MELFTIKRNPLVAKDIQQAVDFYQSKQNNLGKRFFKNLNKEIQDLKKFPFYQIRYKNIRCKLVKNFPYLIHFSVDEETKTVYIHAVICTHKNPENSWI